jgi:hypothetical protein
MQRGPFFQPLGGKLSTDAKLRIVVEGIGNVVQKSYAPSLRTAKEQRRGDLSITFVDKSEYWRSDEDQRPLFENFVSSLSNWADYIDKSTDNEKEKDKYKNLRANVVFIATPDRFHVETALDWLSPPGRCDQIFIEKPLDSSIDKARDLLLKLNEDDQKVRALDHYRARALPIIGSHAKIRTILKYLGGAISNFNFYFTEDLSGPPSVGPLENEGRNSLASGLIMDLMPHVPAILGSFGWIETLRLTGLRVGRYTFIDNNGQLKEAKIKNETFAHVGFSFFHHELGLPSIKGNAYVGKGIRGSTKLGIEGSVKLLELRGRNSKRVRLDFRSSGEGASTAMLIDKKGHVDHLDDMFHDAYAVLLRRVIRQRLDDPNHVLRFDLPIESAKSILIALDEMRHPLKRMTESFPTYHIKKSNDDTSGAPFLEEVVNRLEPIMPFLHPED